MRNPVYEQIQARKVKARLRMLQHAQRVSGNVSFHRFQIIVWTIVLGVVFINAVHHELAMPDFDATLLGLMGLSSGTYIGFKFPEKAK